MRTFLASQQVVIDDPIGLHVRAPLSHQKPALSVIIPLADTEAEPIALLAKLPERFEVILVRGGNRASGMNRAAAVAQGPHLWFVHADTVLDIDAIDALEARMKIEEAIFYFSLRFDGGFLMRLTELGVGFRSRVLKLPFGDQALCLSAGLFRTLGQYDETASIGEDLLLVRRAQRAGIPIRAIGATVQTSARKYSKYGWFKTTWQHLRWTLRLALRQS
jgi:GT2 family glycosyltransferase